MAGDTAILQAMPQDRDTWAKYCERNFGRHVRSSAIGWKSISFSRALVWPRQRPASSDHPATL
jgi:hypothetical protein